MKNKLAIGLIAGFFVAGLCPAISWSETSSSSVKILSISPSNTETLYVGDEVEIAVDIKYKITKSPATISLTIRQVVSPMLF